MAQKVFPLVDGFYGGKVAKNFLGQVNDPKYNESLIECDNWRISKLGNLVKRSGSQIVKQGTGEFVKLFSMKRRGQEDLVVEVTENNIKVYNINGEQLIESGGDLQVNGNFADGLSGWVQTLRGTDSDESYNSWSEFNTGDESWPTFKTAAGDLSGYTSILGSISSSAGVHGYAQEGDGARISYSSTAMFTRTGGWAAPTSKKQYQVFLNRTITVNNPAQAHNIQFSVDTPHGPSILSGSTRYTEYNNGVLPNWGVVVAVFNASNDLPIIEFEDTLGEGARSFQFTPGVASIRVLIGLHIPYVATDRSGFFPSAENTPDIFKGSWTGEAIGKIMSAVIRNIRLLDLSVALGSPVNFSSPYTDTDVERIHSAYNASTRELWLLHKDYEPRRLQQNLADDSWGLTTPIGTTVRPNEWAGSNWPATGCFHEGRLYVAGGDDNSATLYASKTSEFADFTVGTAADSAMKFLMSASGSVTSMQSQKDLIIHTTDGDLILTSDAGVVTPNDFEFVKQNNTPSGFVEGIRVGAGFVYPSTDLSMCRYLDFDGLSRLVWLSKDLTDRAADLFTSGIKQMAYLAEPESVLVVLDNTGRLHICRMDTYAAIDDAKAYYWYTYVLPGKVLSIASTVDTLGSTLWIARKYNGLPYIEVLRENAYAGVCLDGFYLLTSDGSGDITGLDVYDGLYVDVVYQPTAEVPTYIGQYQVSSGTISLGTDWADTSVYCGVKFTAQAETVKLDGLSESGTSQADRRRNNKVTVRVSDSIPPLINDSYPNRDTDVKATLAEGEIEAVDGDLSYSVAEKAGNNGRIRITHTDPFRCEIMALFHESKSNNY